MRGQARRSKCNAASTLLQCSRSRLTAELPVEQAQHGECSSMASSRHCINPACSMIATRLAAVVSELTQRCRRIRHFLGNPLSHNPVPVYLNRQSVVLVTQFESRLPPTAVVSDFSRTAVCGAVLLGASEPLIVESNVRVSLSDCYPALEVWDQILDWPAPGS